MTETGSIKDQIREFVKESAQSKGVTVVSDDESLAKTGIIDSVGIFRLVSFLEEAFSIRIADEEIVHDNFQTINEIERFVMSKTNKSSAKA
jgi:acyl carrier protein